MAKRETRLSTGRTNRSKSAMAFVEEREGATGGRDSPISPAFRRREEALSAGAEMLRMSPGNGEGSRRPLSSLGHTKGGANDDTRLSISAGKWGQDVVPVKGDALDQLLSSSQRRARDDSDGQKAIGFVGHGRALQSASPSRGGGGGQMQNRRLVRLFTSDQQQNCEPPFWRFLCRPMPQPRHASTKSAGSTAMS